MTARQEQTAIDRANRAARECRIRKVARDNPDLTLDLLAERFGDEPGRITKVLSRAGIRRARDGFAAAWTREHRRRAA